jgi:hypothetical protein
VARLEFIKRINFTSGDDLRAHMGIGLSHPEATHTWTLAPEGRVRIDLPIGFDAAVIVFHIEPFLHPPQITSCDLRITVNRQPAFSGVLDEQFVLAIRAARPAVAGQPIRVAFHCKNAPFPVHAGVRGESRHLGVKLFSAWVFGHRFQWPQEQRRYFDVTPQAVARQGQLEAVTGMPAQALLAGFESLGHSCDFGLVQREVGIEPLGLLRFASIDTCRAALGLLNDFPGLGLAGQIEPYIPKNAGEYWILERTYGMRYHTGLPPHLARPEQLIAREAQRLPFLRRKFLEDKANGDKVFLLRRPEPYDELEALATWAALNKERDNTLLYLDEGPGGPPGAVDVVGPGLLKGYIGEKFPTIEAAVPTWLSVCANAAKANNVPV